MVSKVFDIHPHIISNDTERYPITPLGGTRSQWSEKRHVDFAELVAAMDTAGVDKAAIVHSSTTYGYDASYLAESIADHQDRFTGVFSIDVLAEDAIEKLEYWLGRGLSGLRLFAVGSTVKTDQSWIADPRTYEVWQYCQDNNISVAISMRQDGLSHLIDVINRFPHVKIVLDHLMHVPMADGPLYKDAQPMWDMAQYPNVYLKLTSAIIRRASEGEATPESFFGKLMDSFGSERVAWGSNFPAVEGGFPSLVSYAKEILSILPRDDQENIFWRTSAALYPALAD